MAEWATPAAALRGQEARPLTPCSPTSRTAGLSLSSPFAVSLLGEESDLISEVLSKHLRLNYDPEGGYAFKRWLTEKRQYLMFPTVNFRWRDFRMVLMGEALLAPLLLPLTLPPPFPLLDLLARLLSLSAAGGRGARDAALRGAREPSQAVLPVSSLHAAAGVFHHTGLLK